MAILVVNGLVLAVILYAFFKISRTYNQIVDFFSSWLTPAEEGKQSPAGELLTAVSENLARSIVLQAKTTFMGKQSGDVRGETAVMADIAEDALAAKNPLLSGLLNSFPTLKKSLRRNPQLLNYALSKLTGSTGAPAGGNSQVHETQVKFKL